MRISVTVDYPWPGVEPDTAEIEVDDDMSLTEVDQVAASAGEDMIFDRVEISWSVIDR